MADPARLGIGGIARRLQLPRLQVWWWIKTGDFAEPTGVDGGQPWWSLADVQEWALEDRRRRLADRVPLLAWPDAYDNEVADYCGVREVDQAAAQLWDTRHGMVAIVWRQPEPRGGAVRIIRDVIKDAVAGRVQLAAIVDVEFDFGVGGPSLQGWLPADETLRSTYHVSWNKLSKILGRPVPYWPSTLRRPDLIRVWAPDAKPVVAACEPDLDTAALMRLACSYEPTHPSSRTLLRLARIVHQQAIGSADTDIKLLREDVAADDKHLVVAATPLPEPEPEPELNEATRRAGWLEILTRTDELAARCVWELAKWDNGKDLPFGQHQVISPERPHAREWAARLKPTLRTAAFMMLDNEEAAEETFIDPETDAPVIRTERYRESLLEARAPLALPTLSPLAEVIFGEQSRNTVWIRTKDGTLYPAPQNPRGGVSFGYSGGGPSELALLVDHLLDNITARPARQLQKAPTGLVRLFTAPWPDGTVLTRQQLLSARTGEFRPIVITDTDSDHELDDDSDGRDRDANEEDDE